jgi:hypothetical protein
MTSYLRLSSRNYIEKPRNIVRLEFGLEASDTGKDRRYTRAPLPGKLSRSDMKQAPVPAFYVMKWR